MVRLNRIYTRGGHEGDTSLGDGTRVPKDHLRIEAYGTVDELNSVLGLCRLHEPDAVGQQWLQALQNDCFDVGADLCVPISDEERAGTAGRRLRVGEARTRRLEAWIDAVNGDLPELTSFILPGGSPLAAHLHLARTVCRRAERCVHTLLKSDERVNPHTLRYLNRLSDLLFVLARSAAGRAEILWQPTDEASLDEAGA